MQDSKKTSSKKYSGADFLDIKKKIKTELGYDSDLYYDEKDEQELQDKNDLEREQILQSRYEKRQALLERYEILKTQRLSQSKQPLLDNTLKHNPQKSKMSHQSNKQESEGGSQCSQCSDQQKKEKRKSSGHRRSRRSSHSSSSSSSSSCSSGSSSSSSSSSSSERERSKKKKLSRKQQEFERRKIVPASLDEIEKIKISRKQMIDLIEEPIFDDIAKGSFAKVVYENKYRLCEIVKVQKTDHEYAIEKQNKNTKENIFTNREILCLYGTQQKKFRVNQFSNQPITEEEFKLWKIAREKSGQPPVSQRYCRNKYNTNNDLMKKQLNSEEILEKVKRKVIEKVNKGDLSGLNVPYEKSKLRHEIQELNEILMNAQKSNQQGNQYRLNLIMKKQTTEKLLTKLEELERKRDELRSPVQVVKNEPVVDEYAPIENEQVQQMRLEMIKQREKEKLRLMKMNEIIKSIGYAQMIKHQAEEIISAHESITLGIDLKLSQKDFGGFFKQQQTGFDGFKFPGPLTNIGVTSENEEVKVKLESDGMKMDVDEINGKRVVIIKFEDYFRQ